MEPYTPFSNSVWVLLDLFIRLFEHMKAPPKSTIIDACYQEKMEERKKLPLYIDFTQFSLGMDIVEIAV